MNALDYFQKEYRYSENELQQDFEDWRSFKQKLIDKEILEPQNQQEESIMIQIIDDYMCDKQSEHKRRYF